MMTMPTNKAEDTPMTRGRRSRSATGDGIQRCMLRFQNNVYRIKDFYPLILRVSSIYKRLPKITNAAIF